jgi:hypothetical protein
VPDGTDAVGFAVIGGTTVPFSATFDEGGFRARVGRDFLGPDFHANPFALGRRLKAAMPDQTTYLEKPAGVSWKFAAGPFGDALQRFRAFSELWMLPGRVEVTLSATQTHAINPFVLYYRPTHGRGLEGPQLESVGKALLAEAEPVGFIVTMPDASKMTELRREPDAVRIDRKPVNGFGTRATLRLPGSERRLEIFYADDGEAWLSDDLGRIQGAIMDNITTEDPNGVCEKGREGYAEMKGPVLSLHPDVPTLKRLTFGLEDVESGLFTICGYLIH